ncbi:hypothetical protein HMPREF1508_1946 [Shuttleworthella sp. MSX8B]|uniref:Uncharacterized protein n=1 Tax=Shuttleworthella satelles DSM 14600 TaxID=626523 RepID=C4G9G3_9FIRM|nr:hypothetical protein GCWU000342_00616 [Shuttleworthia satelles DSM 14600]EUB12845.1 hypothetical protein HMPREF1508_1946 [Shuttleworthia sp. MSX8B]
MSLLQTFQADPGFLSYLFYYMKNCTKFKDCTSPKKSAID